MTLGKLRSFYERWIRQHRNVEALMGTLLAVEEDVLRRVSAVRPIEGSEVEKERLRRTLSLYEGTVREAIRLRNACEQEILTSAPRAAQRPVEAPRRGG